MADLNPWGGNIDRAHPLMNEDGDWFAFPKSWTRREVVSEMIYNYVDEWWLDEFTYFDEKDECHGWVTAIREMFQSIRPSRLRPTIEGEYGWTDDWWMEDPEGSVECWVVRL